MKTIGVVIVLLCASCWSAAQGNAAANARSNILALEHAWDQAQERGDIKALAAIFDNSLVYVDFDGSLLTKTAYLERVRTNSAHIEQIVPEQMSVQLFGNTAIVVGTYKVRGVENGKAYARRGRFTDTWVLTAGLWICVGAQATPILH
ncbi:MAG: nuclear transport factor 2 family protein [Candidatus Sulfotelmatobacter sp.]